MPGMLGVELATAIKQSHPSLPVAMFSGYAPPANTDCLDVILHKPEGVGQLLAIVEQMLGRRDQAS